MNAVVTLVYVLFLTTISNNVNGFQHSLKGSPLSKIKFTGHHFSSDFPTSRTLSTTAFAVPSKQGCSIRFAASVYDETDMEYFGKETMFRKISKLKNTVTMWTDQIMSDQLSRTVAFASLALIFYGVNKIGAVILDAYDTVKGNKIKIVLPNGTTKYIIKPEIYECDSCGNQLRPARGRIHHILRGNELRPFRCPRCGGPSADYFNTDDLTDPRAVARLERLKERAD